MVGFVERQDDPTGAFYDILVYDRKLSSIERVHYSLKRLYDEDES